MTMIEAVKACLGSYARGRGRASRSEYWWFHLAVFLAFVAGSLLIAMIEAVAYSVSSALGDILSGLVGLALVIAWFGAIIPAVTVTVRRLHDTGKSAHYLWFGLIPFVGGIVLFVFMLLESDRGANAYGPQPGLVRPTDDRTATVFG